MFLFMFSPFLQVNIDNISYVVTNIERMYIYDVHFRDIIYTTIFTSS